MTRLNPFRKELIRKREEAPSKVNSFRKDFERKKKGTEADLEKARSIWKQVAERFNWWGSLP